MLSRRSVLMGGATVAVLPIVSVGCTRRKPHVPTPRETLLDETLALEDELLSAYDEAITAPGLRSSLRTTLLHIRSEHAAHRAALLTAGAQPAPGASASPTRAPTAPPRPNTRQLAATETAAATIRTDTCLRAPRDLATLLASLAASETAHAALLREVR